MDFKDMKIIKELKPSGKMARIAQEIRDSKYLLIMSQESDELSFIDIYDLKDYSKVFSLKQENLTFISELKSGNFVVTYKKTKLIIASLDFESKTLNTIQELLGHEVGDYYNVCDAKELPDGKLVTCSNHGEIIFWTLNPSLNTYEKFKLLNTHPNEYSSLLVDPQRNKLVCAPCFDSSGTCIIDLSTYEIIAKFDDVAGNGGNEIYFVNDNIVIDNSAADEVGLFYIDMDKNEVVKHDPKFNNNNSTCFLRLENDNLLCSIVVGDRAQAKEKLRVDIQCWEIDETGLDWKLLYNKEKAEESPILCMIQLKDGKILTGSNLVKIYQ